MTIEFLNIKRTTTSKKKLMLWINTDICEAFEGMPPAGITVQEKMRQVLKHFVEGGFECIEAVTPDYHNDAHKYNDLADL